MIKKAVFKLFERIKVILYVLISIAYKKLPLYYKNADRLPCWNYFEIVNSGNLKHLNRFGISFVPYFFSELYFDIVFSLPTANIDLINNYADLAIMRSIAARTKDKSLLFDADILENSLNNQIKKSENSNIKMNEIIDFIEISLKQIGSINPFKNSISRVLSLYKQAKKINEKNKKYHA